MEPLSLLWEPNLLSCRFISFHVLSLRLERVCSPTLNIVFYSPRTYYLVFLYFSQDVFIHQNPISFTMVFSLTYRRPALVTSSRSSVASLESSVGGSSNHSLYSASGIPPALSFDRIIDGGTCPVSFIPSQIKADHRSSHLPVSARI